MRTIFFIIQKEFLQIFRNRSMLPLLTLMPIAQLVLLSFAASHEVKNIALAIEDNDHSAYSQLLRNKFVRSGYFILTDTPQSPSQSFYTLQSSKADMVLTIPAGFEHDFLRNKGESLQLLINAINGTKAGLAASYAATIIQNFRQEILQKDAAVLPIRAIAQPQLSVTYSNWYNPTLNYKTFMVPGILGVLVTILTLLLSSMNLVRERELGTIEQLNVTPIGKYQLIIGKLIPFLIIGLADLALGLFVGKLIFHIPMAGSLALVFGFCIVNLITVLGIGLLISTFADTQQQAMFMAWFFMMIFILMSGLFTPIDSMPQWAQKMTTPNPIAHFVEVMRMILLKGSTFSDIQYHFWVMVGLGVFFNGLAVWNYRKTS